MSDTNEPVPTDGPEPKGNWWSRRSRLGKVGWVTLGVFVALVVIGNLLPPVEDDEPTAVATTEEPTTEKPTTEKPTTEKPTTEEPTTEEPTTEEPTTEEPAGPTPEEVVEEFEGFFAERAASGVVIAESVSDVSFDAGVVRVVFDPAKAGIDLATFESINPFGNLAEFAGDPIMFANKQGELLRTTVTSVETVLPDGSSLGSLTAAELYKMGTGEDLPAGG